MAIVTYLILLIDFSYYPSNLANNNGLGVGSITMYYSIYFKTKVI